MCLWNYRGLTLSLRKVFAFVTSSAMLYCGSLSKYTHSNSQRYKSPSTDQIPPGMIQMGGVPASTHLLILFATRKNCHSSERNVLLYLFMRRVKELTAVIIDGYHCYELHTKFYPIFLSRG